jgi:hypothetical protein
MHTYRDCDHEVSHDNDQCDAAKARNDGTNCPRSTWEKLDMGYALGTCPACVLMTPPDTPTTNP